MRTSLYRVWFVIGGRSGNFVLKQRQSVLQKIYSSTINYTTNFQKMKNSLPHFASGPIIKGFGRGSKDLGIPTANYPPEVVKSLPSAIETGIYYGWANVDNGEVYKMVMSIGWNPYFNNEEKSMETHILHNFNRDLYGCLLKVCIIGYLRPEMNFKSLDALIEQINSDIQQAGELLEQDENFKYKTDAFFTKDNNN